jgi:NADH:ubiquinone oxidoreductase subunit 2 (chain N)
VVVFFIVLWAQGVVWFYFFIYLLVLMAVFGVMVYVVGSDDSGEEFDYYDRFVKEWLFLGAVLVIGVGSLAGILLLVGFMGKLLFFMVVFQVHLYALLTVTIVNVVISIFYYFD